MFLVVAALVFIPAFWRGLRHINPRTIAIFAGIGVVVALHWVSFYGAIKLANASVAAACMGVAPIIMSIIKPWITPQAVRSARTSDWRRGRFQA